ncbi:hypothetical protein ASF10_23690 [Flavobacterium sp. Leaf82]|uniref:non-ribosomal peptide synthetase n=1 Tax=Flavobacterium sp. Leaf82 TaxID=1736238 RepID=UPI0006F3598C|nr:non-ribosomal peptide synthetase [Flavobacterium sp. Leaf82]KQO25541.1 hypothetical protein ASF10_23690 [Flavobacterium sp. Leaf82]
MRELIDRLRQNKIHVSLDNENLKLKFDHHEIPNSLLEEIKKNKIEILQFLKDNSKSNNLYTPIDPAAISKSYPLSASQYRLWILSQFQGGSVAYNMPAAVRIKGKIDILKFEKSFKILIDRHEILRTKFKTNEDGENRQYIVAAESLNFRITYEDYSLLQNQEAMIADYLQTQNNIPFDLTKDILLRVFLIKQQEDDYVLFLSLHHIIGDGWSMELLISEIIKIYNALTNEKEINLPILKIQYKDYAVWLNSSLQQEKQKTSEQYWLNQFKGELPVLDLPGFKSRPLLQTYNGDRLKHKFSKHFSDRIKLFSKENDVTVFMILMTGINSLLYRYTGQNDIVLGTPIAGREHPDLENQIGLYLNTLAIRTQFEKNLSFLDLLHTEKKILLEAYKHQSYPFDALVGKLHLKRDASRSALFDVIIDFKNVSETDNITLQQLEGIEISEYDFKNKVAKVDLNFTFIETQELDLIIDYNIDIYDSYSIEKMFAHFENLLMELLENPDRIIETIQYLTDKEKNQLLIEFNNTETYYLKEKTIIDLFEEQVNKTPKNIALLFEGKQFTYSEFDTKVNQLADCLIKIYGIKEGDTVGVQLNKNQWSIITILGILKVGAVFVPIDPELPAARKSFVAEDAGIKLLITEVAYLLDLGFYSGAVFSIDVEFESSEFNENFEKLEIDPKNLAYIIYTSGSTGNPKGVMIEHESLSNYLYWAKSAYLEEDLSNTNFGLFTSLSFDLTLTSLFLPLVSGGSLHLFDADKEISNILKQYFQSEISCVKLTPSHISILESLDIKGSSIELAIVGGEELRKSHVNTLRKINPKIKIYNEYGPTEATVGCVVYEVKSNDESILIGTPISNTSILILDDYQGLQSQGKSGEIYISGSGLARGYINNPELTSEKFIHNPFMDGRMYKTGDLGFWLPDGNIKFLGRKDHQVKIRGHRIELEEIENQILEFSEDLKHVVVAVKESNDDKNLVAYFVSDSVVDKSELRAFLNENLPDYMIPGFYVAITELPLTSNGKIDRNKLPDVDSQDIIKNKYIAPRNETEEDLIKIWEEVLGIEKIGISDNFFELGGHSLVMVQVINRLYKKSGKSISFSDFFKNPTIESLADKLKDDTYIAIENSPEMESYPMSPSQERFWILSQLEGGSLAYNIPAALRFKGKIDADKLEESFRLLIARHEILRTNFKTNDQGENRQYITPADLFDFKLSGKDFSLENKPEENLKSYLEENNSVIFNLEKDLLIRASLIKLEEETYVFYLSMHHIIGDGWSMELLIAEIVKSYNALIAGKEIILPALNLQYKDYAVWLNAALQQEKQKQSEQYWFNQFAGEIPVLNLPVFKTRPLVKTYNGDHVSHEFSTELTNKIKAFSQDHDITIFMILMAGVNTLLHRYTNQYDIIVGTPVAGREHPDLENQLGLYLNTLAIRTPLKEEMNFSELLDVQKETLLNAYEHQNYPFDSLVGKLNLSRDTSRSALFDVLVVLQNQGQLNNLNTEELSNIQVNGYGLMNKISKFDLSFTFMETQALSLSIEYNTDIYDNSLIERMFLHLENIFLALLSNPEISISKTDYLLAEEKQELLLTFNDNKTDYPKDKTIIELFEEQVLKTPDNTAVVFEDINLTFKELNEKANQLGRYLREQYQIKADDLVGIKLDRSEKTIIAMLGILKSGAAYVPIDINYPQERIAYIEQDSKSKVVLDDEELKSFDAIKADYSTENPEKINHANDLVYVIYTSGTTGSPKGVMVAHKNVIRLVRQTNFIATEEIGNILSLSNFSFDGSVFDIFSALLNGTALIIPVQNSYLDMSSLGQLIKDQSVNTFFITTALFNNLTDNSLDLENVRYVLFGGELVSVNHTLKFKNKYPWIHLIHVYGPTENTVFSSYYEVKNVEVSQDTIPIGKAIANSDCYILNANNQLQPIGSVGEICVGGDGLARGYLNQAALTKDKFVPHPFKTGERIYKSGDLGRLLPDGNIEFLNRNDHQVKIRGFRIEPGEIESIILQYSESLKQVFVAVKEVNKERVLAAYLVADDLDRSKLRQYLQEKLPEYMIPGFYIVLKELPLTANGKVDTKALPEISGEDIVLKEYIAPRNETEQKLALIWQNVLGLEKIGVLDNFFELGGHSLMVAQVVNQINKQLGKTVSFKVFFESQTIEKISRQLQGNAYIAIPKAAIEESYPLSAAQYRLWILSQFEGGSLAYNISTAIRLAGFVDADKFEESFKLLINRHEILRTNFKTNEAGEIRQYIVPAASLNFKIAQEDFTLTTNKEEAINNYLQKKNSIPFDLENGPLIRASLIKLKEQEFVFCLSIHHIIGDGWSMELLVSEIVKAYNALLKSKKIVFPNLSIQYKDYAVWNNDEIQQNKHIISEQYWLNKFQGELPILELPAFKTRPVVQTYNGETTSHHYSKSFLDNLKSFSKKSDVTLFMTLMAGINALLHRYTGHNDIIVGTPIAGREHPDLENQLGLYVNTLAIRTQFKENGSFLDLLAHEKETLLEAYEHQGYPFDQLVGKLDLIRDTSRSALFDVMVVLQNQNQLNTINSGEELTNLEISNYLLKNKTSQFDMSFTFSEYDGLKLAIEYNTDIYENDFIKEIFTHFEFLLTQLLEKSAAPIDTFNYLSAEEKEQLLFEFNDTAVYYSKDKSIIDLFENQVSKTPDNIAVVFEGASLTYKERSIVNL